MKKRFIAIICILALLLASATTVFADGLEITKITPKDGSKSSQPFNAAIKLTFNDTMYGVDTKQNQGKFKITDPEGKEQAFTLITTEKYPDQLWLVLDGTLESKTEYKLTISEGILSANGKRTTGEKVSSFATRNTNTDSIISTGMMMFMIAIMIIMTNKATKKAQEEAQVLTVAQAEKLNPYKISKQKKISLEEAEKYIAKEKEKARKAEAKLLEEKARKEAILAEEREKIEAEVDAEERRNGWFKVGARRGHVARGVAIPYSIKKQLAAKRKAAAELAKKRAKNKKKK